MATEKALIIDSFGNEFNSIQDVCEFHKVSSSAISYLRKKGMTTEEALDYTLDKREKNKKSVKDHLGNEFDTVVDMCKFHGIGLSNYQDRKRRNLPLEECLSKSDKANIKVSVDHLGNRYKSKSEMCRQYGVKLCTFNKRISNGLSVEESLTKETNRI